MSNKKINNLVKQSKNKSLKSINKQNNFNPSKIN